MITTAIKKAFANKEKRGWEKMYWAFDIHETILEPNWITGVLPKTFYPGAKDVLQLVSAGEDIVTILYTCSYPSEIADYLLHFEANEIYFDYVNENPEVKNTGFGNFDRKPYFNVLFEDKAGFDAETDWFEVLDLLKKIRHER